MAAIEGPRQCKRPWDAQREKGMCYVLTFMFKLLGRKSACKTFAGSSEILRWLTPFLGPNMDPKWGPELDHIFIPSFRSLLGPRFGVQIWTQKWGQPSEILLLPADVLQADLRRTSMSVSVNTCFFSLCVPICFLYSNIKLFRHFVRNATIQCCEIANVQHLRAAYVQESRNEK